MNIPAFLNTVTSTARSVPIVILYMTAGCNLRCITCSYREPLPNELTLKEYGRIAGELAGLGARHVVYSGGEPLLRRDLPEICALFREHGIRQSLLTNGLLLAKRFLEVREVFAEIIVSLDAPNASTHDLIRGVRCFDQIVTGMEKVLALQERPTVSVRFVVQRRNFGLLEEMVEFGRKLGIDRISFLAADVRSNAFHRDHSGPVAAQEEIILNAAEVKEFEECVRRLVRNRADEFRSGFIAESPAKLMHLVKYFEAHLGLCDFPRNSCNAPMTSMVITSTGDLLPCYFLPPFGNVRSGSLHSQINGDSIRSTRDEVRAYSLDQCHRCVCTLKVSPFSALSGRV
ncbi:MAG TPA: radical SAM/SPASM domain-containing protein [Bacteroidota bacterium]